MGPPPMIRRTRAPAAISVARLIATLTSAARRRAPTSVSKIAPTTGIARTSTSSTSVLLECFELMQIEAVELLADLEEEDAENEYADEQVQRNAQLDHHRHAVGRAGRGEEQAVFHRQESDDLGDRLVPDNHHEEGQQD